MQRDTVDQVADELLKQPEGSRWYVLFPVRESAATRRSCAIICSSCGEGLQPALYQDGRTFEFSTPESLLDIDFTKPLFVLVDRLAITADLHQRVD